MLDLLCCQCIAGFYYALTFLVDAFLNFRGLVPLTTADLDPDPFVYFSATQPVESFDFRKRHFDFVFESVCRQTSAGPDVARFSVCPVEDVDLPLPQDAGEQFYKNSSVI